MIRALFKDSLLYTLPALVSRGISIFLVPLYTRILSTADYGSFDLLMAFSGLVVLVVPLEVSQGLARYYAGAETTGDKRGYASSALWFTVFCYAVFLGVGFMFAEPLSMAVMGRAGLVEVFYIGLIYIALNGLFSLLQNQFRWELRAKDYAVASLIFSLVSVLAALVLAYFLGLGLLGLVYGLMLGAALGCLYGFWGLRSTFGFIVDVSKAAAMLRFSLPLVPSGLAIIASIYMDRLMIKHFMTIEAVGVFGVGARIASVAGLLMIGFQSALTPLIYANYRNHETAAQLAKVFRYFCAVALLSCAAIALFAETVLKWMTSPEYYSASSVVGILAPAVLLSQMYVFAPGIHLAKKTYLTVLMSVIGLVVGFSMNLLLIPLMGIEGAALSTLIANFSVFLGYVFFSQKYYPVPHAWHGVIMAAVFSLAVVIGMLSLGLEGYALWFANTSLLGVVCCVCVCAGLVRVSEIGQAFNWLKTSFFKIVK